MSGHRSSGTALVTDPAGLLEIALTAAEAAGQLLLEARRSELVVSTKSTPTDVVTQMDTAAERLIASTIRARRPDDVLLGEEGVAALRPDGSSAPVAIEGAAVRWIVDPIDGTVNYLYGIPQWAVSIAVEIDGVVEAGVVFDPNKQETYTAIRGRGALLNDAPIAVSRCTELGQALVGTGFGYAAGRRAHQADVLAGLLPVVRDIRRIGSASLDLCYVGCGRFDAYYERGLNLWDHAAAGLIATEAGARVEGLHGRPPSGDLLVAGPPALFAGLHDLLARLDADRD